MCNTVCHRNLYPFCDHNRNSKKWTSKIIALVNNKRTRPKNMLTEVITSICTENTSHIFQVKGIPRRNDGGIRSFKISAATRSDDRMFKK